MNNFITGTVTVENEWTEAQIELFNAITQSTAWSIPLGDYFTTITTSAVIDALDLDLDLEYIVEHLSEDLETEARESSVFEYVWCKLKHEMEEQNLNFYVEYSKYTDEKYIQSETVFGVISNELQIVDKSYQEYPSTLDAVYGIDDMITEIFNDVIYTAYTEYNLPMEKVKLWGLVNLKPYQDQLSEEEFADLIQYCNN